MRRSTAALVLVTLLAGHPLYPVGPTTTAALAAPLPRVAGAVPQVAAEVPFAAAGVPPAAGAGATGATGAVSEHFNDAATGSVPAGWGADTSGGTVGVAALPDQTDRSLRIAKSGTASSVAAGRDSAHPLAGTVETAARVRVDRATGWFNVLYVAGSAGTPAASIAIRDGRFHVAGTGTVLAPASAQRWYVVRVVLRTGPQRFDLYVDGARLLADAPFRQPTADVGRLTFGIGAGYPGILHVDNVSLRRVPDPTVSYRAFDLFDETPVGAPPPPGYTLTSTGGSAAVAAVPSVEDRSLRLAKTGTSGEAGAVRSFPAQGGTVNVLANLRTEETAGVKVALYAQSADGRTAAALQFSDGHLQLVTGSANHVLVSGVRPGEWYTVRLVLDVPARQFTVYVDGRRHPTGGSTAAPTRYPFRDPGAVDIGRLWFAVGAGQRGTLLVDRVLVHQNPLPVPAGTVVDVRDHGAVADGITNDGPAIQRAVDAAPAGGTVLLAGGVFRSGTVRLKSDLTFFVAPDAKLLGSRDEAGYPPLRGGTDNPPFVGGLVQRALLFAHRADNLAITGGGVIDGDGRNPAWTGLSPERTGPAAVYLARGADVTVRDIHLRDSGAWGLVPTEIDGLTIADVDIDSSIVGGRDGIDIVDSHDVLVERVAVFADDDAICFKTHPTDSAQVEPDSPSHGVRGAVVRLSTVGASTRANGVKLGTASHGMFQGIVVEDVLVKNVTIGALVITAVDGGAVHDVTFRRITVDRTRRAVFVLLGRRVWVDGAGVPHPALDPRWVSGLRFEDIVATGIADGRPANHLGNAALLSGTQEAGGTAGIYDVLLDDIRFDLLSGGSAAPVEPDEYDGRYPEAWHWTAPPGYGWYLRHIDGVTVRNVTASVPDPNGRPVSVLRNVRDLR
ncbi:glycosyl hydrolase family 28 protein [Plantactinospora sp. WMMB782]|uniref:glycosyl hydrolase family 28 protein n=1 Tax=Plantactinospora sp. WMMB782 TaxID=3404121 RepID=UPI003B957BB6